MEWLVLVGQLVVWQQLVGQQLVRELMEWLVLVGQLVVRQQLVDGPLALSQRQLPGDRRPTLERVTRYGVRRANGILRLGLTGPIGCGKSTVARWLGERPGVVVVDADQVARDVVEPGEPALDAVIARFGEAFRRPDGSLDRPALGRLVFADPAALRDLEAIVHPAVRPRILAAVEDARRDGAAAIVIEAIKLVEGGLAATCDEVWLVTCDRAVQRERLTGRGTAPADAATRIDAQIGFDAVAGIADRVIDTSADADATRAQVQRAFDEAVAARAQ
jgi:dephospho-CoA kinase